MDRSEFEELDIYHLDTVREFVEYAEGVIIHATVPENNPNPAPIEFQYFVVQYPSQRAYSLIVRGNDEQRARLFSTSHRGLLIDTSRVHIPDNVVQEPENEFV